MAIFFASEYQELAKTMPVQEALRGAAQNRLRPIVVSTLAMVLALIPLGAAISGSGDQMLQPLAIAIIAGILVQLPLILLVMPVVLGLALGRKAPQQRRLVHARQQQYVARNGGLDEAGGDVSGPSNGIMGQRRRARISAKV